MKSYITLLVHSSLMFAKQRTYALFIIITLLTGLIMAIVVPPLLGIDEFRHFNRVIQLAQGGWSSDVRGDQVGGVIPDGVADYEWKVIDSSIMGMESRDGWHKLYQQAFTVPMAGSERMEAFPGAAVYNVFPYFPAVLAVGVFDWMNASVGATLLAGRIAMLVTFVGIVGLALYIVREKRIRWFIVAIALLPKVIFQAGTLNADTLAIAFAILLFSIVYLRFSDSTIKRRWAWVAIIAATLLSLIKFTYIPLAVLAAPLISAIFTLDSKFKKILVIALTALIIITPAILWTVSVSRFADSNNEVPAVVAGVETTVSGKIGFLIHNPDEALLLLPRTFIQNFSGGGDYLQTLVGNIGFNDVRTPTFVVVFSWIALILSAVYAFGEIPNRVRKLYLLQMFISSIAAIAVVFGVLYVSWTAAGSSVVDGVQGRYFIPSLVFLLPSLAYVLRLKIKISENTVAMIIMYGSLFAAIVALLMYWIVTYRILY